MQKEQDNTLVLYRPDQPAYHGEDVNNEGQNHVNNENKPPCANVPSSRPLSPDVHSDDPEHALPFVERHNFVIAPPLDTPPSSTPPPLLLYFRTEDSLRLCSPRTVHPKILQPAHNNRNHAGITDTNSFLRSFYLGHATSKVLKSYIKHCPQYCANKLALHKTYGFLRPVSSLFGSFSIISIDFILSLPEPTYSTPRP